MCKKVYRSHLSICHKYWSNFGKPSLKLSVYVIFLENFMKTANLFALSIPHFFCNYECFTKSYLLDLVAIIKKFNLPSVWIVSHFKRLIHGSCKGSAVGKESFYIYKMCKIKIKLYLTFFSPSNWCCTGTSITHYWIFNNLPDFLCCIIKAFCHKVDRLVGLVVIRFDASDLWVKRFVFALGSVQSMLQLPKWWQKTRAVSSDSAILFFAETKFNCEPIHLENTNDNWMPLKDNRLYWFITMA